MPDTKNIDTNESSQSIRLPFFRQPPVVESVLGVQFDQLEGVGNAQLGLFWQSLGKDRWPKVIDALPIETLSEDFDIKPKWIKPGIGLRLGQGGAMRLQISNKSDNRMIQVQNTRFHYNWRQQPEQTYPRYETVRREFDEQYAKFVDFIASNKLGSIRPNLWEVTYVNMIDKSSLWDSVSDWGSIFPGLLGNDRDNNSRQLQSVQGNWQYNLAPKRGHLHISMQLGKRNDEKSSETIRVQFIARGPITDESGYELGTGLNLGHKSIVNTFTELTSEKAHRFWQRVH